MVKSNLRLLSLLLVTSFSFSFSFSLSPNPHSFKSISKHSLQPKSLPDLTIPTTSSISLSSSIQLLALNDLAIDFTLDNQPESFQLISNPKTYLQSKISCDLLSESLVPSNTRVDQTSDLSRQLLSLLDSSSDSASQFWLNGQHVLTIHTNGNSKVAFELNGFKKLRSICTQSAKRFHANSTDTHYKVGVKDGPQTFVGSVTVLQNESSRRKLDGF